MMCCFFFVQAEDGIRDLVRSRGLGDVYKRQGLHPQDETVTPGNQTVSHWAVDDIENCVKQLAAQLSLIHI